MTFREMAGPGGARSREELVELVEEAGFLPLFAGEVPGFSAEEATRDCAWWSGDPEGDPWYWREAIAREGKVAYGKFFWGRAGFISLRWLPEFVNWRRDGYDFDSRWEDGLAAMRSKKIMDCFLEEPEWAGGELRRRAGFGPGGEKNFEGVLAALQMETYLVIRDFRKKRNRRGEPYGLAAAVYSTPEAIWGREAVTAAYSRAPSASREKILARAEELCGGSFAPLGKL